MERPVYTSSNAAPTMQARAIVAGTALSLVLLFATMTFFSLLRSDDQSARGPSPSQWESELARHSGDLLYSDGLSACVQSSNYWEPVLPLEHALSKHSGLYWNNRIYVIGGLSGTEASPWPTNDVWRAEIGADGLVGRWKETNSKDLPPLSYAAAVVHDEWIYVIGGHDGQEKIGNTYFTHVESDGDTADWSRSQHVITPGRDLHQALVFQDRLYVLGGYTADGLSDEVWVTTIDEGGEIGGWSELDGGLREPLAGFAAVMYREWLYILGGWNGKEVTKSVYFARIESDLVGRVFADTTSLPVRLCRLTAFVLRDRIFVVGGRTHDPDEDIARSCAGVWSARIDPTDGTVEEWRPEGTLPLALDSHTTILVEDGDYAGQVYVVGGEKVYKIRGEVQEWQRSARALFWPLAHVSKEARPSGTVYPSDQITYTITYSNVGTRPLANVIITDAVPINTRLITGSISEGGYSDGSVITWTVEYLGRDDSGTASFQVEVLDPSAAETPTSVPTTAQTSWLSTPTPVSVASALHPTWSQTSASDNREVFERRRISSSLMPDCGADLCLEKNSDPPSVIVGQILSYTLLVNNAGPSSAQDVIVVDYLPDGATFITSTLTPSSTSPLSWSLGSILAESSQEIHLVVQVAPGISGTITNTAVVDSRTWDPNPDDNQDEKGTVVVEQADLCIDKFADPSPIAPGGTLTYTLIITNEGPSDARNVIVTDTLPVGLCNLDVLPPNCTHDPLMCALGNLPVGDSRQVQIRVAVCFTSTGVLTNTAIVASSTQDKNAANNEAKERTAVSARADLSIQKSVNLDRVVPGDELIYTLRVNNYGPSSAHNVVVSDTLPVGLHFRSSVPPLVDQHNPMTWYVGSLVTADVWTIEIRTTVSSRASGILVNTASVTSEVDDPDPSNNYDGEQTLAPVLVTNKARICEDKLWCKESNSVINSPFNVYLPIIFRSSSG